MKAVLTLIALFVFQIIVAQNKSCNQTENDLKKDDGIYYVKGIGKTFDEAQKNAKQLLGEQLSSNVSTRTELFQVSDNNKSEQFLINHSKTISNLKLDGIKYIHCKSNDNKRQEELNNEFIVFAYISKNDLLANAESVKKSILDNISLFNLKKETGVYSINDLYIAYLYSFLTPYPISCRIGNDTILNVQTYLQNILFNFIKNIQIECINAQEHPSYPDEQIRLILQLKGIDDGSMSFSLHCPSINASAELKDIENNFDIIMLPSASYEVFKGELEIKSEQLKEISESIKIAKPIEFRANFKSIIEIDFSYNEINGNSVKLIPSVKHLSPRAFEWFINDRRFSTEQMPIIDKSKYKGTLSLRINYDDSLTISKNFNAATSSEFKNSANINTNIKQDVVKIVDAGNKIPVQKESSPYSVYKFYDIFDFQSLQSKLIDIKSSGKAMVGKKEVFLRPDNCWVFLINPQNQLLEHCLGPGNHERYDQITQKNVIDFESKFKGFIAIWVEFY
jgi:hypothetical protein